MFVDDEYKIEVPFEPKVIFDLGANIGLAAVYFKNRFPGAMIVSVEPESSNYSLLCRNVAGLENVHCHHNGIWNSDTNLVIEDIGLGNWGFIVKESAQKTENSIDAITIESLMKRHGIKQIDLLKIDIEGSEKDVFEKNTQAWLPYAKMIIVECHDRMRADTAKTVFKALEAYDYEFGLRGENLVFVMKPSYHLSQLRTES